MASLIEDVAGEPGRHSKVRRIVGFVLLAALLGCLVMVLAGCVLLGVGWLGISALHVMQQLKDLQESDLLKKQNDRAQAQLAKLQQRCATAEGDLGRLCAAIDDGMSSHGSVGNGRAGRQRRSRCTSADSSSSSAGLDRLPKKPGPRSLLWL